VRRVQTRRPALPHRIEGSVEIRQVTLPQPHPAQQRVIDEAARFNVVVCGRRFGKSTLGIDRLIRPALDGKPVMWASPTFRMMTETWAILQDVLANVITQRNEQEHRLTLLGGGTIDLWSLEDPDTIRGRAYALIVVDEAAQVRELERAWEQVLRPCLTDYQGGAWFLSTPKSLNYFYTLFRRGQGQATGDGGSWRSWQFPTSTNPYLPAEEIGDAERELPERTFQQEYLAQFIEMEGAVFRKVLEAVRSCAQDKPIPGHSYVIGVDWARISDFTVFVVVDTTARCVCAMDRFTRVEYDVQLQRLAALVDRFKPDVVVAEKNSMGAPLVEQLQRDGMPVWPFLSTNESKRSAIETLGLAFERGEIALPGTPEAAILIHELLAFTAEVLPSGLLRYTAPQGGTDDCVIALALAWQAAVSDHHGGEHAVFSGHFNRDRHVAAERLEPEAGWPIVRGIDVSAGYISIIWFQTSRDGKRLTVFYEQQMPVSSGVEEAKRAAVQASQLLFPQASFLDVASAPTWTKRGDELKAPADLFRPELLPQKSEVALQVRLTSMQRWLTLQVGGTDPALQIDPGCTRFRLALEGGYQWKSAAGRVLPDVQQNRAASLMDAFTYALARVSVTGQMDPRLRREIWGPRGPLIPTGNSW
jgi:phage terminase large subunit-like protein